MISDLAYADLVHDGRPAPSIFQVARRARRRGRVLHRLEELLDAGLARRLLRRQPRAGRRADHHQGLPRLRHLRARRSSRRRPRSTRATPTSPRTAPSTSTARRLLCDRLDGGRLDGAAAGRVDVRLGAAARRRPPTWARSSSRPSCSSARGSRSRRASASAPAARDSSASPWSRTTTASRRACAAIGRYS